MKPVGQSRDIHRVLMTADTVGGVWTYAIQLAHGLANHGIAVSLATMGAPLSEAQWGEAHTVRGLTIYESSYKLEWMADCWDDVEQSGRWLLDLEQQIQPDIVHLNGYSHGSSRFSSPVLMVAHSCVISWWNAVYKEDAPADWDCYRTRVTQGLAGADLLAAPTRAMADAICRYYTGHEDPRVIWNGQDPKKFAPGEKQPLILSAGRIWDQAKNIALLERAQPKISWDIAIAGDSTNPSTGEHTMCGATLLGKLTASEMQHWLAQASIYALPARYEPFGLSILEAALSGCALVLGDIESLRELWDGAALFVSPDDPDALAAAINRLIDNPPLLQTMAHEARQRAERYTIDHMVGRYLSAYKTIAETDSKIRLDI